MAKSIKARYTTTATQNATLSLSDFLKLYSTIRPMDRPAIAPATWATNETLVPEAVFCNLRYIEYPKSAQTEKQWPRIYTNVLTIISIELGFHYLFVIGGP